jgi:hypothetical protein
MPLGKKHFKMGDRVWIRAAMRHRARSKVSELICHSVLIASVAGNHVCNIVHSFASHEDQLLVGVSEMRKARLVAKRLRTFYVERVESVARTICFTLTASDFLSKVSVVPHRPISKIERHDSFCKPVVANSTSCCHVFIDEKISSYVFTVTVTGVGSNQSERSERRWF